MQLDPNAYTSTYLGDSLTNKTILITGAGSGIGKAVALDCAKAGATVILLGKDQTKLEAVYDEIVTLNAPQPAIYPLNLLSATDHDYTAMHDILSEEFDQIDGLIHQAGILGTSTPVANYTLLQWQNVFQVNLTSAFMLAKTLHPLLKQAPHASILFTTSSTAQTGKAYWSAYSASKAGLENLAQSLVFEYDKTTHIRVNCIEPGAINTPFRAFAFPAEDPNTLKTPSDISGTFAYLMSDNSKEINGERLTLNGGG